DEVDDDREYRPTDEQVGELHQLSSGFGAVLSDGMIVLFTLTAAFGRSLNTPEVATSSPGFTPSVITTWSPCARPSFTNCWRTPLYGLPSGPFMSSRMNTELPYGA